MNPRATRKTAAPTNGEIRRQAHLPEAIVLAARADFIDQRALEIALPGAVGRAVAGAGLDVPILRSSPGRTSVSSS